MLTVNTVASGKRRRDVCCIEEVKWNGRKVEWFNKNRSKSHSSLLITIGIWRCKEGKRKRHEDQEVSLARVING